jgi:hypothetical protein
MYIRVYPELTERNAIAILNCNCTSQDHESEFKQHPIKEFKLKDPNCI